MFKSAALSSGRALPLIGGLLLVLLLSATACSSDEDETEPSPPSAESSSLPEGTGDTREPATATSPATVAGTTPTQSEEPTAASPAAQATPTDQVSLTGVFAAVIGDPFDNSDVQPKFAASLTDQNGVTWRLFFDANSTRPPGPLLPFNGKTVLVEGTKMPGSDDAVLVKSLTVL